GGGALWIATNGAGICRLDQDRIACAGRAEGLFDDTVLALLDDGAGTLWLSSNHGIASVDEARLKERLAGGQARLACRVLGARGGADGGSQPAAARARAGRLWFATEAGAAAVDPRPAARAAPPPVVIESVALDGTAAAAAPSLSVPPRIDEIEIRYTALALSI